MSQQSSAGQRFFSASVTDRWLNLAGRCLIAILFLLGAVQKLVDPLPVMQMLSDLGLTDLLVWPVALFNLGAGIALIVGYRLKPLALILAVYCIGTSYFHFIPADGWQMSIFVKNWAIAGGLLILASQTAAPRLRTTAGPATHTQ